MESEDVLIIDENNYSFDEIKLKKKVNVNSNNIQNNIETKKNKKSNIFLSKVPEKNLTADSFLFSCSSHIVKENVHLDMLILSYFPLKSFKKELFFFSCPHI